MAKIRLYSGVPCGAGRQISWSNRTTQMAWFATKQLHEIDGLTNVQIWNGEVKVQGNPTSLNLNRVDYISIEGNESSGGTTTFGKVTGWHQTANQTVAIGFDIDYWQTYQFQATFSKCLIEREHPTSAQWNFMQNKINAVNLNFQSMGDSYDIAKYLRTAEPIEPSWIWDTYADISARNVRTAFSMNSTAPGAPVYTSWNTFLYIIYVNKIPTELETQLNSVLSSYNLLTYESYNIENVEGSAGILRYSPPMPATVNVVPMDSVENFIRSLASAGLTESIIGAWLMNPNWFTEHDRPITYTNEELISGYSAQNVDPKMYVSPYLSIYVTSNTSESRKYDLNKFYSENGAGFLRFIEFGAAGPKLVLCPINYNGRHYSYPDRIEFTVPAAPYAIDSFLMQFGAELAAAASAVTYEDRIMRETNGAAGLNRFQRGAGNLADLLENSGANMNAIIPTIARGLQNLQQNTSLSNYEGMGRTFHQNIFGDDAAGSSQAQRAAVSIANTMARGAQREYSASDLLNGDPSDPYAATINIRAQNTPNEHFEAGGELNQARLGDAAFILRLPNPRNIEEYNDFFTYYGYAIGRISVPGLAQNLAGQQYFPSTGHYIKTVNCVVASVPAPAVSFIQALFDSGVRMTRNGDGT